MSWLSLRSGYIMFIFRSSVCFLHFEFLLPEALKTYRIMLNPCYCPAFSLGNEVLSCLDTWREVKTPMYFTAHSIDLKTETLHFLVSL